MDLFEAASEGMSRELERLLSEGADPNLRNAAGNTPLMLLLKTSHINGVGQEARQACLRLLLEAGADANDSDPDPAGTHDSALMLAIRDDDAAALDLLLRAGANLQYRNKRGETVMKVAEQRGRLAVLQRLEQAGIPRKKPANLAEAAWLGDLEAVRTLLAAGATADAPDRNGRSPLMLAVLGAHFEVFAALVDAGAALKTENAGLSLLHFAARSGSVAIGRALLDAGFDANLRDRAGHTPLMSAAMYGRCEFVRLLLDAGADPKRTESDGMTAVKWAKKGQARGSETVLALLQETETDVDPARSAARNLVELAKSAPFLETLEALEGLFGKPGKAWSEWKGVYRFQHRDAKVAEQARKMARKAGYLLLGSEPTTVWLFFPTDDKYAAIHACRTHGSNYDQDTDDIVAELRQIERDHPFELRGCGEQFLSGTLLDPVGEPEQLALRLVELCPDLVDGDAVYAVNSLSRALEETQSFYLWWD